MADGNFLPEVDRDFLAIKEIQYVCHVEEHGGEQRRGVEFLNFALPSNLFTRKDGALVPAEVASVLVLIPKGYAAVRLDSWYLSPGVFLANGQPANCAGSEQQLFSRTWQFWSRHLVDADWRDGIDGLETYLDYIRAGLREA